MWYAVQAEMKRRASLRSVEESGNGRYSYAFSDRIECGCCGAGFRRFHAHGERLWICKQRIKSAASCASPRVKEKDLEDAFVRTLNGLVKNRNEIMAVVGDYVNEALTEADEFMDDSEVIAIDEQIDKLQTRIMELTKQRGKREIDAEQYATDSREVMEQLNGLFAERERIAEQRNTATLSKAFQAVVADFLSKAGAQAEFDRDIFARLVHVVRIKSHDHIIFVLKDGTEVRATTAAVAA